MCLAESHVNSRLAPRIRKVQEFGRPTAAASIHICVSETVPGCTQGSPVTRDWPTNCENMGCTQGPRVTSVWPTACCCEHTHVCCKIESIQGCTQGRHVTRVRPTRCCCEPTHMLRRIFLFNVARKGQKLICRCEHTYTHVFQNNSIQACTPKSRGTRAWPVRCCCAHACACCRMSQYRVAWITGYKGWPTSCCCEHTHMCVAEKMQG